MEVFGFKNPNITDFMSAFYELVDNGFNHGCQSNSDSITAYVSIYSTGIMAEVVNDNRRKTIPDPNEVARIEASGARGQGLKTLLSIADHWERTQKSRGIQFYLHKYPQSDDLMEDGITVVHVGGYSRDVAGKISQALEGKRGDVIVVFPEGSFGSMRAGASIEITSSDAIRRFAIVSEERAFAYSPKLVGCFRRLEEARGALRFKDASERPRGGRRGTTRV
jgi:anti-sigma regulatory factor (Ser/Thr protein kinase)